MTLIGYRTERKLFPNPCWLIFSFAWLPGSGISFKVGTCWTRVRKDGNAIGNSVDTHHKTRAWDCASNAQVSLPPTHHNSRYWQLVAIDSGSNATAVQVPDIIIWQVLLTCCQLHTSSALSAYLSWWLIYCGRTVGKKRNLWMQVALAVLTIVWTRRDQSKS